MLIAAGRSNQELKRSIFKPRFFVILIRLDYQNEYPMGSIFYSYPLNSQSQIEMAALCRTTLSVFGTKSL
jgi:hypothetical protein